MTIASGISGVPDMARVWSGKTPDKAALIDGGRVGRLRCLLSRYKPVEVSGLVSHCRGLIAGYKVPKEIHLVDALPQTASGKVQKAALRQQLQASPQHQA